MKKDFEKYLKSKVGTKYTHMQSKYVNFHGADSDLITSNVFDKLLKERIIILSGELDPYLCEFAKSSILYMESIDNESDITLYINSPGGSVYDGLGLLDIMDYVKPDISTINTGLAASMGAIILTSGCKGKRKSLKRSRVMIHQPLGYGGYIQQASDMEIEAKEINHVKKELYEIISNTTGQPYDRVWNDSDRDYWMNSEQAKEYGMIDEILIKRT